VAASTTIPLYRRQLDLIRATSAEVLGVGEGGGKSFALRTALVLGAAQAPGSTCVLAHPSASELKADHLEGPGGLKALLSKAGEHGAVEVRPETGEARFANGSSLLWLGLDRAADLRRLDQLPRVHLAAVDEAHRLAADQYDLVRQRTGVDVGRGRVLLAAARLTGWLEERWGGGSGHVVEFSERDLPEVLRPGTSEPTLAQWLERLGVPILMPDSRFRQTRHVQLVVDVLQRWYWGEFARLMVLMPTQMGKTMMGVRAMVPYIVSNRPYETVGITSYSDGVALNRSQDARDFFLKAGGALRDGATGRDYWRTPQGGGAWAAGFAGAQSGNPMTWGVVDDPDRNEKESRSEASVRDKDGWYPGVWLGREAKFADRRLSQLWLATRFWSGDTCARTLRLHVERGEAWHVLALPALYDPKVAEHYRGFDSELVTVEPDWRTELNEPIWPEEFDREYWEKTRRSTPRIFLARDQQMPVGAEGGTTFDRGWVIDLATDPGYAAGETPEGYYSLRVRAWDLAATEGGGDWTASVSIGETRRHGRIVVRHAARARLGTRRVMRFIAGTMVLDGPGVVLALPEDPAAGGKQQTGRIVDYLREVSRRLTVPCEPCDGQRCRRCDGRGQHRLQLPRVRTVSTREPVETWFRDFAERAFPVSTEIEGSMDYVRDDWRPTLVDAWPHWDRAVALEQDRDWQGELRQVARLMRELTSGTDPDLVWLQWQKPYLEELHLFPDTEHDDWAAATAHAQVVLAGPRRVYPS
jgi:hypothetical protein